MLKPLLHSPKACSYPLFLARPVRLRCFRRKDGFLHQSRGFFGGLFGGFSSPDSLPCAVTGAVLIGSSCSDTACPAVGAVPGRVKVWSGPACSADTAHPSDTPGRAVKSVPGTAAVPAISAFAALSCATLATAGSIPVGFVVRPVWSHPLLHLRRRRFLR